MRLKGYFADMKRLAFTIPLCIIVCSVSAQFKNIKLADLPNDLESPFGPSITLNKKNPENIIAAIAPDKLMITKDGGLTWSETKIQSPLGLAGYPTLVSNHKGDEYLLHLTDPSGKGKSGDTWMNGIALQKTADDGATWKGSEPLGVNAPKIQYHPSASLAYKKQDIYVTWTQFDKYQSSDTSDHSNILLSVSDSDGKKWTKPVQINQVPGDCQWGDDTAMGASIAIDAKGKLFVAWSNRGTIYFDRSYDNARTWLNNDIVVTHQPEGWNLEIPGIGHSNGLPMLTIDNSLSRYSSSMYLVWADQRNGKNDSDIWFMRTGNGGDNWTQVLRVNKDGAGKQQFLPSMTVDQVTGYIYIMYYDQRNSTGGETDVYLAYSADGGSTFNEAKVSESSFIPGPGFSPEHNHIAAYKGIITPIWTRMDDGKLSIWTSIIRDADFQKK